MQLHSDSLSDQGKQRSKNEDACFSDPNIGLFMVADGMGGHPAGDVASGMAISCTHSFLQPGLTGATSSEKIPELLDAACQQSSQQIYQAGLDNSAWRGMGTTLALACCLQGQAFLANVGDSRIYLLHDGSLTQCSYDHTLGNRQQIPANQQTGLHHILTQALGLEQRLEVYQQQVALQTGDRLLLCSDGLSNMLSDDEISRLLRLPRQPKQVCQQLVAAANDRGGLDNITAVVIMILGV